VVSLSETKMRGIDPSTGAVIWEHNSKTRIQMFTVGDDLLLSGHVDGFVLHRFSGFPGFYNLRELWQNRNLTLEYDMPVHHKGYLYGFNGWFLNCLKLETGENVWSSDEAGSGMAILVDGHLAIVSDDGSFKIARAWEKGYDERTSIQVFEDSGLTEPSYANGVFYMRNYSHIAAVRVNRVKK